MRKTRIAALGIVAAVVAGVLFQLPASPFARHGYPERPASVATDVAATAEQTAATGSAQRMRTGEPVDPDTPGVPEPRVSNPAPGQGEPAITYPVRGTGGFSVLPGDPAPIGRAGKLFTFQLAIEGGITGIDRAAFASFVRATYAAPQGWTAGGLYRFRQVGPGEPAAFQLMLVTPATRDAICGGGFDQYTSCRIGDRVVLNVARWVKGVPHYGADLTAYRQYMINHETGHRLGHGHELCPGPGKPAPVMEQQTLGLHGCTAYSWPYRNGARYKARLGQYNDKPPAS